MLSLLINTKPLKKLIFPDDQKLWRFFAITDAPQYRIESSKRVITGRFRRRELELARERFGADVVNA